MSVVVDTSVWINAFRSRAPSSLRSVLSNDLDSEFLLGDIVLLEILQGARDEAHALRLEAELREFPLVTMMRDGAPEHAARNYRRLRSAGVTPRSTVDVIIATFCLEGGHHLLHADRDFDAMEEHLGVLVYRP